MFSADRPETGCYGEKRAERWQNKMKQTSQRLRIAMIGHKRVPSREGGIEVVVEELGSRMVALGHEVTCFNRRGKHIAGNNFAKPGMSEYKGIKVKTVITFDKKGFAALTSSFFASVKAAFGTYDVVHYHAEGPCAMMWIPKLSGKRCVVTIHGLDWARDKWKSGFASKYIKFGEKVAVKCADEIIVLSENVKRYFADTYKRETHFIPNGVSKPVVREADKITGQYGLTKDSYILFLGRIVPEKGLHYLIEAFKSINTEKRLVIAGSASDTDEYFGQIKQAAVDDSRILFTGFVWGEILEELYSNAYFYVLPSALEGMPLSLLEAMSYGNCCLVSDIAECVEVVEDKAVIFRSGVTNDLQNKLTELCGKEELVNKYKAEAAKFICGKYNWDDVACKTLDLFAAVDEKKQFGAGGNANEKRQASAGGNANKKRHGDATEGNQGEHDKWQ
jgi:glycosyltransferase involved in cell wall biosynthesis